PAGEHLGHSSPGRLLRRPGALRAGALPRRQRQGAGAILVSAFRGRTARVYWKPLRAHGRPAGARHARAAISTRAGGRATHRAQTVDDAPAKSRRARDRAAAMNPTPSLRT